MKMKRGFTLIETIIYIALLAFIMGGALSATYNIIENAGRLDANVTIQEEGNFVLRKINWALSGASSFSTTAHELTVTRYDGITVVIKLSGTEVDISEDGGVTFLPLTTSNVTAVELSFIMLGTAPKGVKATLMLNGTTFSTTKYLRK